MRTLLHLLGHGAGLAGVLIGLGSILRVVSFGLLRFIPFAHGLTSLGTGAPLSIALLTIAAMIFGSDGGGTG